MILGPMAIRLMINEAMTLTMQADTPPINPMVPASAKNIIRMSETGQPSDFIIPISRVRSEMDMIMVLIMPRAATNREMAPRPPSISCFCWTSFSRGLRMLSMDCVG